MTRNSGRWKGALKEAGKQVQGEPKEEEVIAAMIAESESFDPNREEKRHPAADVRAISLKEHITCV